ncbi:MAG: hydroxymethylbilane synthase [Acidobacteriota bacterium]|nr:hydroxymethylbilane synthase [Acidobacteriota bacterium]
MLRLATRGSPLALWQARLVSRLLPGDTELVVLDTAGDRSQDRPVWELGGQGVFVKEIQAAVLDGRADAAVHSAKDLPSRPTPGLVIAAVAERADPRDVLVGGRLADLAPGAPIATGSVRRRAQLAWARPDLTFVSLRGNIAARMGKVPPGGALVVAAAALDRLGLRPPHAEALDPAVMLPQVGQGAIAVECRDGDRAALEQLGAVDHPDTRLCVEAERAFLARLGGGCDLPVGAHAVIAATDAGPPQLHIDALVASLDGRCVLRSTRRGDVADGARLGRDLAEALLAAGGSALLDDAGMRLP